MTPITVMPPLWLQLLSLGLQAAPSVETEITDAVSQHWGKDHMQQIQQGLGVLSALTNAVNSTAQQVAAGQLVPPAPQATDAQNVSGGH